MNRRPPSDQQLRRAPVRQHDDLGALEFRKLRRGLPGGKRIHARHHHDGETRIRRRRNDGTAGVGVGLIARHERPAAELDRKRTSNLLQNTVAVGLARLRFR